jgi:hypothetical protein
MPSSTNLPLKRSSVPHLLSANFLSYSARPLPSILSLGFDFLTVFNFFWTRPLSKVSSNFLAVTILIGMENLFKLFFDVN